MLKAIVLLLTTFFSGSHQQCLGANDVAPPVKLEQFSAWVESGHRFSATVFKELDKERKQENMIISPWSMQEAILLAYFGAKDYTEETIANILHLTNQDKALTWRFYSNQRALNLQNTKSNPLKSANKIFISNKLTLRKCIKEKFENELELIDYKTDVEKARRYINAWVANQTDGQITNLIEHLSHASTATLVNAVFYKSKWLTQFNPKYTHKLLFHVKDNDQRPTDMMLKIDAYQHGHCKDLGARMLMLPYLDNRTAMIVLLPDKELDATIESLTAGTLRYISDKRNYKSANFEVLLPKYKHKSILSLKPMLEKLGLGNLLSPYADFSVFTGRKEIFFDTVSHQAAIKVDEEGTAASAATGMTVALSNYNTLDFRCNRPFAYIIYDFGLNKVLFMGTYRKPQK